jgi:hypothetical protein
MQNPLGTPCLTFAKLLFQGTFKGPPLFDAVSFLKNQHISWSTRTKGEQNQGCELSDLVVLNQPLD